MYIQLFRRNHQKGEAFFIPTAVVPPLFVTHVLIFLLLLRPSREPVVGGANTGPLFVPGGSDVRLDQRKIQITGGGSGIA